MFCLFAAVYANTELASAYLAGTSPTSQQHMLLYVARTTYLCWAHLAEAVRWVGRGGRP